MPRNKNISPQIKKFKISQCKNWPKLEKCPENRGLRFPNEKIAPN